MCLRYVCTEFPDRRGRRSLQCMGGLCAPIYGYAQCQNGGRGGPWSSRRCAQIHGYARAPNSVGEGHARNPQNSFYSFRGTPRAPPADTHKPMAVRECRRPMVAPTARRIYLRTNLRRAIRESPLRCWGVFVRADHNGPSRTPVPTMYGRPVHTNLWLRRNFISR